MKSNLKFVQRKVEKVKKQYTKEVSFNLKSSNIFGKYQNPCW